MYEHLSYGRADLCKVMRDTYDELIAFVTTPEFKSIMLELSTLDSRERQNFISSVLLNHEELARRGVCVPPGVLIQRSAFGDRRPTLFAVKKFLPADYTDVWQNVNLTFDNPFRDDSVARTPEISWRKPLPVDVQAEALARGQNLEEVCAQ
jgi:hypothetical protein